MRRSTRLLALLAALIGLASMTAACGSDATTPDSGSSTKPRVINVDFKGATVKPNGEKVQVGVGQEVELEVTADKAGQIHVHSDPEQQKNYGAGTTRISLGSFKMPGQFVVESHALDKTIVILEVQ